MKKILEANKSVTDNRIIKLERLSREVYADESTFRRWLRWKFGGRISEGVTITEVLSKIEEDRDCPFLATEWFFEFYKLNGVVKDYYNNGKTWTMSHIKNGKRNGDYLIYFKSGRLQSKRFYKNGLKEGLSEGWYSKGQKFISYRFRKGKLHGVLEKWHTNGRLSEKATYKNDELNGYSYFWDRDGRLYCKERHINGKSIFCYAYDENGVIVRKYEKRPLGSLYAGVA